MFIILVWIRHKYICGPLSVSFHLTNGIYVCDNAANDGPHDVYA